MTALAPYLLYIGLGAWLAGIVLVVALCVAAGRGDDHLRPLPGESVSWPCDGGEYVNDSGKGAA